MKRLLRGSGSKGGLETRVTDAVKKFCDSGAPNKNPDAGGSEITYLPTIVEGAESSPAVAGAAAYKIRKLLEDGYTKPYIQYNCLMLIRILVDNPGPQFTQHLDPKFVAALRSCLHKQRDPSVQQILRETLYYFAASKSQDTNLAGLLGMWQLEQASNPQYRGQSAGPRPPRNRPPPDQLPPPDELAARISEAKSSAQLLIQLSESTPPQELAGNELMKEFSDRVQTASRNLNQYMNCQNPAPDEHTFRTLIETCEQLNVASSRHQRAVLAARQLQSPALGQGGGNPQAQANAYASPVSQSRAPPLQQEKSPYARPTSTISPQVLQQQYTRQAQMRPPGQQQRLSMPPIANNAAPPQPQAFPRDVKSSAPNPFSDDNRILADARAPQTNGVANSNRSNVYELAGSADEDFAPPTGPPPTKSYPTQQQQPVSAITDESDDDDDLYNNGTTPVTQRYYQNGVGAGPTPGQYGAPGQYGQALSPQRPEAPQATESYVKRQDQAGSNLVMHGAGSPPPAAAGGASKIRDDEPMTPLTPSAWR